MIGAFGTAAARTAAVLAPESAVEIAGRFQLHPFGVVAPERQAGRLKTTYLFVPGTGSRGNEGGAVFAAIRALTQPEIAPPALSAKRLALRSVAITLRLNC